MPSSVGEVNHIVNLAEQISSLYLSDDYSDVTLIVNDEERFPSHKVVLAARSEYFRALLFGGLKESTQAEVALKVNSLPAFRHLLKYVYSGHLSLTSLKEEMILEVLGLSHQYGFIDLETAISDYFKETLNIRNVCIIYDTANLYRLESLAETCCQYIDRHALEVIRHESFYTLSVSALKELISRDSFCAQEIEIFHAVYEWYQRNSQVDLKEIVPCIRLSLISTSDLLKVVRPSGLVSADEILDAIHARTDSRDTDLRYRGCLLPEENVASPRHNAQVTLGEMRSALLDGDVNNYDMEKGFTRHHIDDANGQGILIRLGTQCIINYMRMLLWDKDHRSYSYYIEVSIDSKDWVRVIDHSQYLCRSWQYLYFAPRVAKYVRIVGTHNTVNRVFHVVSFECMYTQRKFVVERGLLVPNYNVATVANSAVVLEGTCCRCLYIVYFIVTISFRRMKT